MDYKEALEYVRNVLDNWESWKAHHILLTEALVVIMRNIDKEENR